jgi:hypothetical protein
MVGRSSAQQIWSCLPIPDRCSLYFNSLTEPAYQGSLEISDVVTEKFSQFSQLGQKRSDSIPTMLSEMLPSDRGFRVTLDPTGLVCFHVARNTIAVKQASPFAPE